MRLVVIGDSLSYWSPDGGHNLANPDIFPNVLAKALAHSTSRSWEALIVARSGWSIREFRIGLREDPFLAQQVISASNAIVVQIGSKDSWAVGIPPVLSFMSRYLRPP